MSRGWTGTLATTIATAFAVLLLAACGSSDSDSSSSDTTTGAKAAQGGGESSPSRAHEGAGDEHGKESGAKGGTQPGGKKADVSTPLVVSGGGSGQFESKFGDNSIQEFGDEGGESELQEAAEVVHGFFVARAEGRWADACGVLSASLLEQLQQLAEKSERANCASFLASFTTHLSPAAWRAVTTIDAGSLRREGEEAFLLYYGAPGKTVYAMPLKEEGGAWKLGALSGDTLTH